MIFLLWIYNNVQHVVWTLFLVRKFSRRTFRISLLELFFSKFRITENKSSFLIKIK